MSDFREQLLSLQKKAYHRNLRRIRGMLCDEPFVKKYEREYKRYLHRYESTATREDLVERAKHGDIVYHGDYHTLRQSQRSVLRMLRALVGHRKLVVCAEIFHGEDQTHVDAYLKGDLTEVAFLHKIDFARKWGFKWQSWVPVFDFCRKHRIPVLGINTSPGGQGNQIAERDEYASRIIALAHIRNPGALVYTVVGDFHISPNHLPRRVTQKLKGLGLDHTRTIVYQNADNLYWRLTEQHLEETDVLKINHESYCLMNTTPANKLQSYLSRLEHSEDAYYPVHPAWEESSGDSEDTSVTALVNTICMLLKLPHPDDAVRNLDVHYGTDLDFLGYLYRSRRLRKLLPEIRRRMVASEAFMIEYERTGEDAYLIYLPTAGLNMAAEEATHFINAALRGRLVAKMSPFDRFYRTVMSEALAFFGSKLINEKRKAPTRFALREYLRSIEGTALTREDRMRIPVSRWILEHRSLERETLSPADFSATFENLYRSRSVLTQITATQLGYMTGNKLYGAVKGGEYDIATVRKLFADPFSGRNRAFEAYAKLCKRLSNHFPGFAADSRRPV